MRKINRGFFKSFFYVFVSGKEIKESIISFNVVF